MVHYFVYGLLIVYLQLCMHDCVILALYRCLSLLYVSYRF